MDTPRFRLRGRRTQRSGTTNGPEASRLVSVVWCVADRRCIDSPGPRPHGRTSFTCTPDAHRSTSTPAANRAGRRGNGDPRWIGTQLHQRKHQRRCIARSSTSGHLAGCRRTGGDFGGSHLSSVANSRRCGRHLPLADVRRGDLRLADRSPRAVDRPCSRGGSACSATPDCSCLAPTSPRNQVRSSATGAGAR